jgi:hypothetical protein
LETLVKDKQGFENWLKFHNAQRHIDGNLPEGEEEFNLIPINLFD